MERVKLLLAKSTKFLATMAFAMAVVSANTTCILVYHQPKAPRGLNKYRLRS
jgi:hypothetical protein